MGKTDKPRICQVLKVEVGERFRVESDSCCLYPEAFVDEDEIVRASAGYAMDGMRICQIIKGELRILRKPRFTREEVGVLDYTCKCCDIDCTGILERRQDGTLKLHGDDVEVFLPARFFPSLRPGQAVALEEIIG